MVGVGRWRRKGTFCVTCSFEWHPGLLLLLLCVCVCVCVCVFVCVCVCVHLMMLDRDINTCPSSIPL
jgi:hypothetical protein